MRTQSARELAYAFNSCVPAFAHDICCAEIARQRDSVGVSTEHDDLLGAEPAGGDHAAESNRAVAHDRDALSGSHSSRERGVMSGPHHIRQRQQRWHQRRVVSDRQGDQRAVGERHAHGFALTAIMLRPTPPPTVHTRRLEPFAAEYARAVGNRERRDDKIASFHGAHVRRRPLRPHR